MGHGLKSEFMLNWFHINIVNLLLWNCCKSIINSNSSELNLWNSVVDRDVWDWVNTMWISMKADDSLCHIFKEKTMGYRGY